MPRQGG